MSLELISLGKLLVLLEATKPRRTTILRTDIRTGIKKEQGYRPKKGGDFYVPFWADVKNHVVAHAPDYKGAAFDLRDVTPNRIAANDSRSRLYPELEKAFLEWWEQKRRLRNEPFHYIAEHVKGRHEVAGVGTIKVENTLCFTIGDDGHRIIYPYFCDDQPLSQDVARLGLWVMSKCVKSYALGDLRILDALHSKSFSVHDTPLRGNEEAELAGRYAKLLEHWETLRSDYA